MRKLTYYVGASIDGFIAGPEGQVDFYPVDDELMQWFIDEYPEVLPVHIRDERGVDGPNKHFDVGIMGRATYDPGLKAGLTNPYPQLRQYVVSRSITQSPDPSVEIIDDPLAKVRELKSEDGKGIYLMGGGRLAGQLLAEIDELVIKVYPVVAGAGIPVFHAEFSPVSFALTGTRTFDNGVVVLTYARR